MNTVVAHAIRPTDSDERGSIADDERGTTVCDDGVDNDLDGNIDYRVTTGACGSVLGDMRCSSVLDTSEMF